MEIRIHDDPEKPVPGPGFYAMPEGVYHGDPCPAPSLSASLIKRALPLGIGTGTMRHLQYAHPKLTPIPEENDPTSAMTFSNVFHKLILAEGPQICVIDAKDWRTADAKAKRDEALAAGQIPVLPEKMNDALVMFQMVREQLSAFPDLQAVNDAEGVSEVVAIWQESTDFGDVWCRARIDRLPFEGRWVLDWKSTATTVSPDAMGKWLFNQGCDIQDAWYSRGVKVLTGRDTKLLFGVAEQFVPHGISVHAIDRMSRAVAERKTEWVLAAYAACLASDVWPGHVGQIAWQSAPPWSEQVWIEREDAGMTTADYLAALIEATPKGPVSIDPETAADFGLEPDREP